jgi:hypothetical protein
LNFLFLKHIFLAFKSDKISFFFKPQKLKLLNGYILRYWNAILSI